MKKLLALATAGAMALAVLAATANTSQAAPWQNQQNWQGQNWQGNQQWKKKKSQGQHWQGQQNWSNNNWNQGNWNNPQWKYKQPPKFHAFPKPPPKFPKYAKYPKKPVYKHYQQFNAAPFVFGFALGALTAPYWYDEPVYAGYDPHVLWCLRAYPNTYNPARNTYYIRPGVIAVCISPYSQPPYPLYPY